jgi:uncharacterized protein HemX
MPEERKESKGAKTPFDPHKLLDQLKGLVAKNKKESGGGKSWVGTLIIIAVVLVGIAIWSWISFRRGRELAKLRHEKNKAKILKEKAEVDRKVAEGDAAIAEKQKSIDAAEDRLQVIEADIRAEEARYEADMRAIDSIRSWRDAGFR